MLLSLLAFLTTALAAGPSASSTLEKDDATYAPALAFDGLLSTGWAEGEFGSGEGQWVELDLGRSRQIDTLSLWPGNLSEGAKSFREYTRPRTLKITVDGEVVIESRRLQDEIQRVDLDIGKQGRTIRVEVLDAYEGFVFQDLFIAEVAVNYPENVVENTRRFDAYLESDRAKKAAQSFKEELDAMYGRCKAAEFGDSEAFAMITDAVADGPTFLRPIVVRTVPAGFRAQAIQSSRRAQKAIRKLLDPNGIAALELAALRATDKEAYELADLVERFYAYQELKGGPSRNVGYWGEPGWAPGQLQGFGEPLAIEADRYGGVWVADTANNRLQKWDEDGKPVQAWGPSPDIASDWFEKSRKWYVAGSKPGEKGGEWMNPVDVEVIPGKESDGFAGLDAQGRIQIYNGDGRPVLGWKVETKRRATPGIGGSAYLEYLPSKELLVAIIEEQAVVYTLESEEVGRYTLEDGTPNAAEIDKKGRLLLAYGDEVVATNALDGFRYGTVIDDSILGIGFEDMDLAMDEEDRLWIVTDTGWAFKFKKPGKLEQKTKVIDRPIENIRFAVHKGVLFMTSNDTIERLDVIQIRLDQAQAEKDKRAMEAAE